MKATKEHNERMVAMTFASVYPNYIVKVESKNRSKEELPQIIEWLTGFNEAKIQEKVKQNLTFKEFFEKGHLTQMYI